MLQKSPNAENGVVSPVIALSQLPEAKAGAEHRSVNAARKLLHAGKHRLAVNYGRSRLNDAGLRMIIHHRGQAHHGLAGHDAVGVEHDHIVVIPPPAPEKIGDVAALSFDVIAPVPIKDSAKAFYPLELAPKR